MICDSVTPMWPQFKGTLLAESYDWHVTNEAASTNMDEDTSEPGSIYKTEYLQPPCWFQGPLLLTWFNFNPSMDK